MKYFKVQLGLSKSISLSPRGHFCSSDWLKPGHLLPSFSICIYQKGFHLAGEYKEKKKKDIKKRTMQFERITLRRHGLWNMSVYRGDPWDPQKGREKRLCLLSHPCFLC